MKVHGVEVRKLEIDHPIVKLHSDKLQIVEFGLFATKRFNQFDCIGEYCGQIIDMGTLRNHGGKYVASFDVNHIHQIHTAPTVDLYKDIVLDAEMEGNELRFINSYRNIEPIPNVVMRSVVVNKLPCIIILCSKHSGIEPGEEILLDYGDEYNQAYNI